MCNTSSSTSHSLSTLSVATVNVRYDGQQDNIPIPDHRGVPPSNKYSWTGKYAENPWAERRSRLVDALVSGGPLDIVGFQEVLYNQLNDLSKLLGEHYAHVGVGRDDGKRAGEYSPIFYDQTKFKLIKWGTVWLSPTPDVPGSKGWDASQTRIATLLSLQHRQDVNCNGPLIHVINTHYDDQGIRARAESSLLIRSQIYRWVKNVEKEQNSSTSGLVVLLGDFNSPPEEDGYRNITSLHSLPSGQPSYSFLDAFTHLHTRSSTSSSAYQSAPYGPVFTYTGFNAPGNREAKRIDFVMLGQSLDQKVDEKEIEWKATKYSCVDNWVERDIQGWEGRWSDHRAVRVTFSRQH